MAERRMFAKTIIDSDAFLDMPMTAQCLYFHLAMRADDEGFLNNPKKVQRMVGASDDDLKLLLAKRFILVFESGVIVIKHWRIHNYIRSDRFKPTTYADEKALLTVKPNGSYTECTHPEIQSAEDGIPDDNRLVYQMDTQVRLGKDRVGKDRLGNTGGSSDAHTHEEPEPENDLGRVMDFFMDRINPTPSPMAVDFLKGYTERLGADVVLHALGIALDERKTGWSYIHAILQRYERDGLTSMDAVLRDETERTTRKDAPQPPPPRQQKPNQITGSTKSRFTGDELSGLLAGLDRI